MFSGIAVSLCHLNPWQAYVRSGGLPLYCLQLLVWTCAGGGRWKSRTSAIPVRLDRVCSPQDSAHPLPSVYAELSGPEFLQEEHKHNSGWGVALLSSCAPLEKAAGHFGQ